MAGIETPISPQADPVQELLKAITTFCEGEGLGQHSDPDLEADQEFKTYQLAVSEERVPGSVQRQFVDPNLDGASRVVRASDGRMVESSDYGIVLSQFLEDGNPVGQGDAAEISLERYFLAPEARGSIAVRYLIERSGPGRLRLHVRTKIEAESRDLAHEAFWAPYHESLRRSRVLGRRLTSDEDRDLGLEPGRPKQTPHSQVAPVNLRLTDSDEIKLTSRPVEAPEECAALTGLVRTLTIFDLRPQPLHWGYTPWTPH